MGFSLLGVMDNWGHQWNSLFWTRPKSAYHLSTKKKSAYHSLVLRFLASCKSCFVCFYFWVKSVCIPVDFACAVLGLCLAHCLFLPASLWARFLNAFNSWPKIKIHNPHILLSFSSFFFLYFFFFLFWVYFSSFYTISLILPTSGSDIAYGLKANSITMKLLSHP